MDRLLLVCAVLLISASATGAESLKLSIKDAVNMALENNNQIKAARFTSDAASQGVSFFRSIHPPEPLIFQEHSPTPFSRAFTHLG